MSVWLYIKNGPHIQKTSHGGYYLFDRSLFGGEKDLHTMEDIELPFHGKLHPDLERLVWKVSSKTFVPMSKISRAQGEYRYRSARGTITRAYGVNNTPGDSIAIIGDNIHDVSELYSQIRAGTIVPEVPYDVPQVTPLRNFNELLREMWRLIRNTLGDTCYRITYDEPK